MKKFMVTFAAVAAGFAAQQAVAEANSTPENTQPTQTQSLPSTASTGEKLNIASSADGTSDFVLKRASDRTVLMDDHDSHSSHDSHESHASHDSHASHTSSSTD